MPTDARSEREPDSPSQAGQYLVVARRYRPKSFEELVGQQHVAQALRNAILTKRVGHAYLFTGARGVGKTSAARIFAKALNCVQGPSPVPCNDCDICLSIDAGEDVDVLEIDGASNRGIEEIRQLRSNVNVRPSRAPYKIYIIDEVHMLTTQAFNALLKTLEEPPEHVKFIFCTTDADKIPITVLSRCQRFDFAPIGSEAIVDRLRFILSREHREADDRALALLARRAGGSMRDSQSLLEQLLAFAGPNIAVQDVQSMLGAADTGLLGRLVEHLLSRDPGAALVAVDEAMRQGAEAGHLAEQLLAYFRDLLVATAGGASHLALQADAQDWAQLAQRGQQVGLETLLAIAQVLDQTLVRMRQSTHGRTLLELAIVRIAALERLDDIAEMVQALRQGQSVAEGTPTQRLSSPAVANTPPAPPRRPDEPSSAEKKTAHRNGNEEEVRATPTGRALDVGNAQEIWREALAQIGGLLAEYGNSAERVAISGPNQLVVSFPAGYNLYKDGCERLDRKSKIEKALEQVAGQRIQVQFELLPEIVEPAAVRPTQRSTRQMIRETERHELVSRAIDLFDAEIVRVDSRRDPKADGFR